MRLDPRTRKLVLLVHVVTAVGWLGAEAVLLVLGVAGLTGSDPGAVYPAAALVGTVLVAPLSLTAWLSGIVAGLGTPWGLVRHWWVAIKLALTTVMTALVFLLLLPNLRLAAEAAGTPPRETQVDLVAAASVATTLLLVSTVLSVYKPKARLRARRPNPARPNRIRSDMARSNTTHPDPARPAATQPDSARPATAQPNPARPAAAQPDHDRGGTNRSGGDRVTTPVG